MAEDTVTVRRRSNPTTTMTPSIGGLVSAGRTPGEIAHALDVSLDEAWDRIVKAGLGKLIAEDKRLGPLPEDEPAQAPAAAASAPIEAASEPPTTAATAPSTPPQPPPSPAAAGPATSTATSATPPTKKASTMTADAPQPDAPPAATKKRGGRPKGSKNAPGAAPTPALSAADRRALAVGKVYLAAEAAGCSVKELVALIAEGFSSEG